MADEDNSQRNDDINTEDTNIDHINNLVSEDSDSQNGADEVAQDVSSDETSDDPVEDTSSKSDDSKDEADSDSDEASEDKPVQKKEKPKHISKRTTHRSTAGKKLYAVRDKSGKFKDIQQYSKAHAMDIKRKSKAEIGAAKHSSKSKPEAKKTKSHLVERKEKTEPSNKRNLIMWIAIGVLAVILIIALILVTKNNAKAPTLNDNSTDSGVAATVNGDPIYMKDITAEYNKLSPIMQQAYNIDYILNKSIDDLLLYQEARNSGIVITSSDIDAELETLKKNNMMSDKELEDALKSQGLTIEDARKVIEKNMIIREYLNKTILQDIEVTDNDVQNYYELHIEEFREPAKVTIRHILVQVTDTFTDTQAKVKIAQISNNLTEDNFCEYVTKYSEDPGSVANCGEYTFAKGEFNNPEFENPSFDLRVGEKTIVQTVFGYHIIVKLADIPAKTLNVSEVRPQIELAVHDQIAQDNFDKLLLELREKAVIVNYVNKVSTNDAESQVAQEENLEVFAKCLTSKGAKFYGAYWCPHCANQKELFGDAIQYVTYVECAVEDQPQVQTAECDAAEITGYPTWVVGGQKFPGEQTLARLSQLTGCSLY